MFDSGYFYNLPDGEEKIKYLKKCIDEADKEKDSSKSLELRYMYIRESVFNGDCYKAVIMFPEYMSLFDKLTNPGEEDINSFMIAFKWIIEDIRDFYQVSREMAESYFEEFRVRCERYGYSLRTYYMKTMLFYADTDPEKSKELWQKFRQAERDDLSDCAACEMNHDICVEFLFGTEEKAISMLEEMKKRGISCAEVPEVTFGKCVEHFTKIGAISEAQHYADMLLPMIDDNDNFLMEMSHILLLKALTDTDKAYKLFTRSLDFFVRSRNPKMRFYFADASARFFKAIADQGCDELTMSLPHSFEKYNKDNLYSVSELQEYFYSTAKELAEKFDNRNGSTGFMDKLTYQYPETPVKKLKLPRHSTADKIPLSLAIPFRTSDSFPSGSETNDALISLKGIELQERYIDDETNSLVFIVTDEKSKASVQIVAGLSDICNDMDRFNAVHPITQSEYEGFIEDYGYMLILNGYSDEMPADELLFLLLKLAVKLNKDASPFLLELVNYRLLPCRWAEMLAEVDVPPLDNLLFRVYAFGMGEDNKIALMTSGLSSLGSRQLIVRNADEENVNFIVRLMSQICTYVTGIGNMPDENTEIPFGVSYNEESQVMFGWRLPTSVYSDAQGFEDDEFAVPYISFTKDGKVTILLLNEISTEDTELFRFRDTARLNAKRYALANATFRKVAENISENDILIAGLTVDIPEEYCDEYAGEEDIYVRIIPGTSPLKGVIDSGIDGVPGLSEGDEITISDDEYIFFWRIENSEGEYYFPDEAYLFI